MAKSGMEHREATSPDFSGPRRTRSSVGTTKAKGTSTAAAKKKYTKPVDSRARDLMTAEATAAKTTTTANCRIVNWYQVRLLKSAGMLDGFRGNYVWSGPP